MISDNDLLTPLSTMAQVLERFTGAQRALFKRYHIGGCSSCAFQQAETLEQLCRRNNNLDVMEMIEAIRSSHEQDAKILIAPAALAKMRQHDPSLRLLDVRTREEHDAVHIEGAVLMSQPTMQEILARWPRQELFVIYDHVGSQALDAAAFFAGHGFEQVRCLRGGIDAWSREVDLKLPRYVLG